MGRGQRRGAAILARSCHPAIADLALDLLAPTYPREAIQAGATMDG